MSSQEKKSLRSYEYGLPSTKEYPMPDAAHVRAAEAYFRHAPENKKAELANKIMQKAKRFGVNLESSTIQDWAKKK